MWESFSTFFFYDFDISFGFLHRLYIVHHSFFGINLLANKWMLIINIFEGVIDNCPPSVVAIHNDLQGKKKKIFFPPFFVLLVTFFKTF